MAETPDPQTPEIENPQVVPPVIEPQDDPVPDLHDDPPPEIVNLSQEDEEAQAQSVADNARAFDGGDPGLTDTTKVGTGDEDDDVEDLVDHMNSMVASGRIDMDAYRGERNDDGEDGMLGAGADED